MSEPSKCCGVCGAPAESLARDIHEKPPVAGAGGELWETFQSSKVVKSGCAEHPAESLAFMMDGRVLVTGSPEWNER